MRLFSNDFKNGEMLPKILTCDGEDISPHLKWVNFPEQTKSFALMCLDFETNDGIVSHWYVHDIPNNVTEIPRGGPIPGAELENDFGTLYYEGPCQPDKLHEYYFIIHALDVEHLEGLTTLTFRKQIRNHSLDKAELKGTYQSEIRINFKSCH